MGDLKNQNVLVDLKFGLNYSLKRLYQKIFRENAPFINEHQT
jgi:hypothetical protein